MSEARLRCGEILLVDDSAKDVRLIREVLCDQGHQHQLTVARSGEEALERLRSAAIDAEGKQPDLVLLDINLPRLSGIEVLSCIKSDPALRQLPVLMLTTSRAECDVTASYEHHANGYLVKPARYDDFAALIGVTLEFWLEHSQLPKRMAPA